VEIIKRIDKNIILNPTTHPQPNPPLISKDGKG
jgi:hypothetical protein